MILPKRKSKTLMDAEKLHADNIEKHSHEEYVSVPKTDTFVYSQDGLTTAQAEELLRTHGKNELPEKVVPKWYYYHGTCMIDLFYLLICL